jgi:hypothetical protein
MSLPPLGANTTPPPTNIHIPTLNLHTVPPPPPPPPHRRSRILDIKTLEEDPGAAQEFARSKASARKEGLTGVEFKDIAGLDPILGEVLEVRGGGWGC